MEENEFSEPPFGEIVDLVRQYEDAVKKKQQLPFGEEDYENIIQYYQDSRENSKLIQAVEAAIEQFPFSAYFYTKKAEILANQKRFDEALAILEEAEKLDPQDINNFLIRADVRLWEGKHQEALDEVEYALSISTDNLDRSELYLEMADIYEDQEKYPEVVAALKKALKADPNCEEALNRYWFCTELNGTYEESIKFHEALINRSPYSYLAWFNIGHAYAGLKRYEEAFDAFGYVIAIQEDYDGGYICSGDVLFNMERYTEAIGFYQDAINLSKPNKELYLKMAECHEMLEDYSKSRSYLRKAIAVDPYYDEAFFRIGESYRYEEKWMKAISSFERAVKLNKDNVEYLTALADAYMECEESDKAVFILERVFQLDAQSKENWINLATAYFNAGNYRKAFQVLNEAEQKYDSSADIYYTKGVFYYQAGNKHEALINIERGLLLDFDGHTLIFMLDESLVEDPAILQVIEQYRE